MDDKGGRRSEVFAEQRDANFQFRRHRREAEEGRRGLKLCLPPDKTLNSRFRAVLAHHPKERAQWFAAHDR